MEAAAGNNNIFGKHLPKLLFYPLQNFFCPFHVHICQEHHKLGLVPVRKHITLAQVVKQDLFELFHRFLQLCRRRHAEIGAGQGNGCHVDRFACPSSPALFQPANQLKRIGIAKKGSFCSLLLDK